MTAFILLIICMKFRRVFFMTAFMTACIFVVLAEMGDKTQLLAMAFATKYNWKTVMAGVFALENSYGRRFCGNCF